MALIAVCACDGRRSRSPAIKIVSYAGILDDVARLHHSWQCDAAVRRQHKKQVTGPMASVSAMPGREAARLLLFLMFLPFLLFSFDFRRPLSFHRRSACRFFFVCVPRCRITSTGVGTKGLSTEATRRKREVSRHGHGANITSFWHLGSE